MFRYFCYTVISRESTHIVSTAKKRNKRNLIKGRIFDKKLDLIKHSDFFSFLKEFLLKLFIRLMAFY